MVGSRLPSRGSGRPKSEGTNSTRSERGTGTQSRGGVTGFEVEWFEEEGEERPEQLWKTWDKRAQKAGEHATVYHANGDKYRGQYLANMRHGQGTLTYKNGSKYEGEFMNDKQHGHGTHWANDNGKLRLQYRGGFGNGKRQGSGTFAYSDGGRYDGEWYDGKRHGQGRMTYVDGTVYEGAWQNGMRHGPGTLFMVNGDTFQGEYALDMKEGPGTFYYVSSNKRYDGVWSKDVAKCGLYGEMTEGVESTLPQLKLLQPIEVLETRAYELEEDRAGVTGGQIAMGEIQDTQGGMSVQQTQQQQDQGYGIQEEEEEDLFDELDEGE